MHEFMGAHQVPPYDNDNYPLPATRQEAIAIDSKKYFTGEPCVYGHIAPRYTRTRICAVCSTLHKKKAFEDNPGHARELKAKFRAENPGVHAARARDYRARNLEKVRATEKKYRDENPLVKIAKDQNRRARKNNAGTHTKAELAEIISLQSYQCGVCKISIRKRQDRHLDHIVPLSKGGRNDRSNLQFLCVSCNLSKGDKDPEDFMRSRGFLI
jgi:5-methylcytosine-specific restriction endonuclease McrA